jgi:hypothetical protein
MASAGLSDRFEAAQSAAFREAVNASTTRCTGRASGEIGAIPAEPTSWKKYNMESLLWPIHTCFSNSTGLKMP